MTLLALLLVGCSYEPFRSSAADCEDVALAPGEVRVCRLGAGDLPDGSGARVTDFRLQNALLDVIVRAEYAPLTRLQGPGGTVIAATPTGAADPVLELVPTLPGGWFSTVEITQVVGDGEAGLELVGVDGAGQEQRLVYRLAADSAELVLDGAVGFTLVPQVGAERVGGTVEQDELVVAAAGEVSDRGGEVEWLTADRVVIAERRSAYAARWEEVVAVSGTAAGATWVEARAGGTALARLPVDDAGSFSGEVPAETDGLVAVAEGHGAGAAVSPGQDLALSLGAAGSLRVRAVDEDGQDLPALVERAGRSWVVPAGGTTLPVGPGTADTWLWAGPGHEALLVEDLAVEGEVELGGVLRRVGQADQAVLAELDIEVWPDAEVREPAADRLARAWARGVGYAVVVADDEVAQDVAVDTHVAAGLALRAGSRAATEAAGQPVAWPWSASAERAAHGAAPWHRLAAPELLASMRRGGQRYVVADAAWLEAARAAGSDADLDDALALRLDELDELPTWFGLLDEGRPVTPVGPWTWVEGVDPDAYAAVDVEAGLVAGRTIASSGPAIHLRVDGEGPGALLAADTGDALGEVVVELVVTTPAWAPIDRVVLHGPGGTELAAFPARPGPVPVEVTFDLVADGWLVAVAEGSTTSPLTGRRPWAVTSPVWLD